MLCVYCALLFLFFSLFVFLFCLFAIYLLLLYWANKDEYWTKLSSCRGTEIRRRLGTETTWLDLDTPPSRLNGGDSQVYIMLPCGSRHTSLSLSTKFRMQCIEFLSATVVKLVDRSPLKCGIVHAVSCLVPRTVANHQVVGWKRNDESCSGIVAYTPIDRSTEQKGDVYSPKVCTSAQRHLCCKRLLWLQLCHQNKKKCAIPCALCSKACDIYKEKTMLNLLHVYTSPNHGSCFTVLTRNPRDPFTFVDPFDLWPADPLSAVPWTLPKWSKLTTKMLNTSLFTKFETLIRAFKIRKMSVNFEEGKGFRAQLHCKKILENAKIWLIMLIILRQCCRPLNDVNTVMYVYEDGKISLKIPRRCW